MTDCGVAKIRAVLFDLDGTLVDTAPDMVAALAGMQEDRNQQVLPYSQVRSHVSNGAAGLVRLAFPDVSETDAAALKAEFLERYEQAVCVNSSVFPELNGLLDTLDSQGLPWGVVTNKPMRMTTPVMAGLGLDARAACAVSGDTLPERKPHPAPLLLASREIGVRPEDIVYVGDASRDIEAGRAAGMSTIAVCYGYIPDEEDPRDWGADLVALDGLQLTNLLLKGVTLAP